MRGRKPIPPNLRLLHGSKPARTARDPLTPVRLRAPRHLSPGSRAHFKRLAKRLYEHGITCSLDYMALELLADQLAIRDLALAALAADGYTMTNDRGHTVRSPWSTILKTAEAHALKLFAEFGMTPTSRVRVQPLPSGANDDDPDGIFDT